MAASIASRAPQKWFQVQKNLGLGKNSYFALLGALQDKHVQATVGQRDYWSVTTMQTGKWPSLQVLSRPAMARVRYGNERVAGGLKAIVYMIPIRDGNCASCKVYKHCSHSMWPSPNYFDLLF